jgi:hypothetical protein
MIGTFCCWSAMGWHAQECGKDEQNSWPEGTACRRSWITALGCDPTLRGRNLNEGNGDELENPVIIEIAVGLEINASPAPKSTKPFF